MTITLTPEQINLSVLRDRFHLQRTAAILFLEQNFPELTNAEKHRLDRVKSSFLYLMEYPPLLEDTVKLVVLAQLLDLADFYQPPTLIRSEQSIVIYDETEELMMRGKMDITVWYQQLWIMVIEAKRLDIDIYSGLAQILSYMLATPHPQSFGLISNGLNYLFVRLDRDSQQYMTSSLFSLFNPGNQLYQVLQICKYLRLQHTNGKIINNI